MSTYRYSDLVDDLSDKMERNQHLDQVKTRHAVAAIVKGIADALIEGNRAEFRGFGSFRANLYKTREGRNPATGEKVQVPAKARVAFKPALSLRDRIDSLTD